MRTYLDQLHVGAGTQIGPVTTFPVWTASGPLFATPDTAGLVASELAEPRVDSLQVRVNGGRAPVLLAEGTLLRGGMQTRVVTHDVIVTAGRPLAIDATCVEAGRWSGGTTHSVGGRVPVRVIAELRGLRRPQAMRHDSRDRQGRVWESVSRYEQHYGRRSTSNLDELMNDVAMERPVQRNYRSLAADLAGHAQRRLPGQSGIVIGVAGQPVLMEIFPSSRQFAHHLPALLQGIALDAALLPSEPTPARRARRFVERLMSTELSAQQEIEDGVIYGAASGYLDVRALDVRADAPAHVLAINSRHDLVLAA